MWVAGDVPNANSTNFTATVDYASGSIQGVLGTNMGPKRCSLFYLGPIKTARLDIDGQTILDQAFRTQSLYNIYSTEI